MRTSPRINKRMRFGKVEYYHRNNWFFTLWFGNTELQFNRWPKSK